MGDTEIREGEPPYYSGQAPEPASTQTWSRRGVAVLFVCTLAMVFVVAAVVALQIGFEHKKDVEPPVKKGELAKKFADLTDGMTKAEVEAILGAPTSCMCGGGSKSTCEQYDYGWRGDDGLVRVTYSKLPNEEFAPWGPPGKVNRIMRMHWQPAANVAN